MFLLEPDDTQAFVNDDGTLIVAHDAGFFSCCTIRLRKIIQYYNHFKRMPHVDSSMQWSKYKDRERDVTHEYFMPCEPFECEASQIDFTSDHREDQFSYYRNINYLGLHQILVNYFSPSFPVIAAYERILNKYKIDFRNSQCILYRGLDKGKETTIPDYDTMLSKVDKTKKLIIQTDELEFLQYAKQKFPKALHFDEAYMVTKTLEAVQNHISPGERITRAVDFLAILIILSKCNSVILNSGNVGMWLCLFRANADNVNQYLDTEWLNDTPRHSWS